MFHEVKVLSLKNFLLSSASDELVLGGYLSWLVWNSSTNRWVNVLNELKRRFFGKESSPLEAIRELG